MPDLDIAQFWKDDALAHRENCFSKQAPQVALGIRMSEECVFAQLGEEGNPWGFTPRERRIALNKRYNELALKTVGIPLLREEFPPEDSKFPAYRQIGEVFGGQYVFDGKTTWLKGSCSTNAQLEAMLDRVDRMDFESFVLPENWYREKKRIYEEYGLEPYPFSGVRGPVTLATSIFGVENFIYLLYDAPELADRLRDTIERVLLQYIHLTTREAGLCAPLRGFGFADDDCCLLTPELYERFGYPILKKIFDTVSPDPGDNRHQHSDSAMGHLLPILSKLNLTGCNFGPTVTVREIRAHMPRTRIDGQLAPFTFMRNNVADIIAEVKRDCEMAKENDLRGLNLSAAGSINNGSLLESMRTVMATIQEFGRY